MKMHEYYESPLCKRYAGKEMKRVFSDDVKFATWRKLWIALAESEKELGLPITDAQIAELKAHIDDIDYDFAAAKEKEVRHDVMAHVHTYGEKCPNAKGIIHLGATSCYVCDNADVIIQRQAMLLIKRELLAAIRAVAEFAEKYKGVPTLAYTHFQAAQPTTVGKRATLWLQDLLMDLAQVDFAVMNMKLLGCKGTTGTAASFLELFDGDAAKVEELEKRIVAKLGFDSAYAVSGQTYTRKADFALLSVLSGIAQSAHKFSNDIRLLSHLKEVDEPFEKGQVGSSAMAYKRNPMRSERIASLARYCICDLTNPAINAASQWLERTLDDSANRRIAIPEAFLCVDAILALYINVVSGLKVYPKMMEKHLKEELPFMATENILMYCVSRKGGDRQRLHEAIRLHSVAAAEQVKLNGGENDLLECILADATFGLTREELDGILDAGGFTGLAEKQTEDFLAGPVKAALDANAGFEAVDVEINV